MATNHPGPAYRIHTQRLVVRCWNPEDAPLLTDAINASLEHLRPWMPWAGNEPHELQQTMENLRGFRGRFDLGEDFVYGILNRDETRVLGGSGLHTRAGEGAREIGYWIHQAHANQGFATEVSAALVRVAFEVDGVNRVEIHCDPANAASASIPKKLGFQHEATLRQRDVAPDGSPRDTMIWSLFAGEYVDSPSASAEIDAFDAAGHRIL